MRRAIQQLPPDLVNRIAAGEVIERPASVVKELVENALDAGAGRVIVEIDEGGTSLIRVTDDGGGIPPGELPLAFAAHATSKLRDDAELAAVATMGFRGEALASIASVSRCRLLSRCGQGVAHELRNDGGRLGEVRAAAGNAGTCAEVRDLFFNVPARRKFLKGAGAESAQVTEMLTRLALPRPDVAFRYLRDGRVVWDWPATGDGAERLRAAWPGEYHQGALPLDAIDEAAEGAWHLGGIVGLPEFAATTGRYQHLYVNGRPVRDRSVSHALREAYRGLTEPGRHPAAVLLLRVPPGEVDVNVHPTKAEVRFRHPSRLWGFIHSAVREALLASDLVPRARPAGADATPPRFELPREDVRQTLASFFKDALGQAQQSLLDPFALGEGSSSSTASRSDAATSVVGNPESLRRADDPTGDDARLAAPRADDVANRPVQSPGVAAPLRDAVGNDARIRAVGHAIALSDDAHPTLRNDATTPARAIQLHNSYLVVQSEDGIEIIDQHALHERVLYEELLARLRRGPLESQRMLLPMTFEAPEAQVALLDELRPTLMRLGVEAEAFGPDAVAVSAFPSFLTKLDPAAFVRDLLERAEGDLRNAAGNDEAIIHEVLDLMACKAAVKAGDPLAPAEIDALVSRRGLTPRHSNCPHGRPTTLKLSLGDLERQFKRTGF